MSVSSPTANPFDLLKDLESKKKAPTKPAPKKDAENKPGPAKKLTPEERRRIHEQEEAEKARAANEQKLEAALVSQHEEESRAEGFVYTSPHKTVAANSNKLSRTEWEAKKAKGEPLADQKEAQVQTQQPAQQPQGNKGNRNFDNSDNHAPQRRQQQQHHDKNSNEHHGRGPKPGREFDRHSQATTGRKAETKRGGGGKYNVGSATEDLSANTWVDNVNKDETATVVNDSETAAGEKKEGEEKTETTATTAPEEAKPFVPDPDDEGYGKKTFQEFEKQKADQAEALKNLVGSVEKRTELEKKVDLSKCIEADKIDTKLNPVKQQKVQNKAKQQQAKAKVIDFNELKKEQGVLSNNANSPNRNNRSGPNRNLKINNNNHQFPSLGEEPSQNYSRNENWSNNSQRTQNRPPRQQNQGQNQGNQQPRTQGQGQGQKQGQKQGNQGQNKGNQGQKNFNNRNNSSQTQGQGTNSV